MSGYNKETGIFGLTWTKASFWFRREDVPENCRALRDTGKTEFFACFLRRHGLEVLQDPRVEASLRID